MPFKTLTGGLELVIPTSGTRNWAQSTEANTWVKINNHKHGGSGDGEPIESAGLADGSVTSSKLHPNIALTQQTLTPAGTAQTIDWDLGSKVILNLGSATGNVTLTLSNVQTGGIYRIEVVQGATVRQLIWPAAVKWQGGQEPSQFMNPSSINLINLDYDGTIYLTWWDLDFS